MPILLVAVVDNELAGSVSLVPSDMPHHKVWAERGPWLSGLFVRADLRRRGIGNLLIAACEDQARQSGVDTLLLYTSAAEGLYERAAWKVVASVFYAGEANVVMQKQVAANGK